MQIFPDYLLKIALHDSIMLYYHLMKPIYTITDKILSTVSEASLLLGRLQATSRIVPAPQLRKQNQLKTIQGTLAIEGNTLSLD